MTQELDRENLQFFGKISATVSHDIKNVLAVINEGAGLLEDLVLMTQRGMELDPERVRHAASTILEQVRRGDGIVKNMNTFAHSVDEPVRDVELCQVSELMCQLVHRIASRKSSTLSSECDKNLTIYTDPYTLEYVLFEMVTLALENAGGGAELSIKVSSQADGAVIRLAGFQPAQALVFPEKLIARSASLGGTLSQEDAQTIILALPGKRP